MKWYVCTCMCGCNIITCSEYKHIISYFLYTQKHYCLCWYIHVHIHVHAYIQFLFQVQNAPTSLHLYIHVHTYHISYFFTSSKSFLYSHVCIGMYARVYVVVTLLHFELCCIHTYHIIYLYKIHTDYSHLC
jgi:hypothetical protein